MGYSFNITKPTQETFDEMEFCSEYETSKSYLFRICRIEEGLVLNIDRPTVIVPDIYISASGDSSNLHIKFIFNYLDEDQCVVMSFDESFDQLFDVDCETPRSLIYANQLISALSTDAQEGLYMQTILYQEVAAVLFPSFNEAPLVGQCLVKALLTRLN